jgi:hypothetical protein
VLALKLLFVDVTSDIVNNPNFIDFEKSYCGFKKYELFSSNFLALNFGKTHLMQFVIKHSSRNEY